MNKYYVSNYDHNFLNRISEIEFETFKNYKNDLWKFTNLFDCYQNYKQSEIVVREYLDTIDDYQTDNLNEVYRKCKYIFMQNIMFGRIFIDNAKSYCKQLNRCELKRKISEFELLDEVKMLKLLRDFGQHFSLPFSNLKIEYSLSDEKTTKVEPLISIDELKRNKNGNKQNKLFIQALQEVEVSISSYYEKWSIKIEELYALIREDFTSFTDITIRNFIVNNILCYRGSSSNYIPVGLSKAELLNQNHGFYRTVEFIPFDELALLDLFSEK